MDITFTEDLLCVELMQSSLKSACPILSPLGSWKILGLLNSKSHD